MSSTFTKPNRRDRKKILAKNMKPGRPEYADGDDGEDKFFAVFVDSKKDMVTQECTPQVFSRIEGKRRAKRPHTGLKKQINTQYLLAQNAQGVIEGIDVIPNMVTLHTLQRADLDGVERIIVEISNKGEVEVLQRPQDVSDASVIRLIMEIDKVSSLETGQTYGGFEVVAIDGNKISFDYEEEE